MKKFTTVAALLAFASTGFAAEPPKVKEPPALKRASPNCVACGVNCPCPGAAFCADGKCQPATAQPTGTLRTVSGALIRPTANGGYEYVAEGAPITAGGNPPQSVAIPQSFGGGCANGQCPAPSSSGLFRRR